MMRKELLELRRDPRLFVIVIIAPIIQLSVLGYAATTDVKDIPLAIVDADRSSASRELIHRFEASENFKIVAMLGATSESIPTSIAAQPTRGLDVGAIEYLHRRLVTERDEGRAVLLVSLSSRRSSRSRTGSS